jgi:D-glycero-alpha-D-manno-heptose-7-phosphate kinase
VEDDPLIPILERYDIRASAPCRIDMGGTLDIRTFFYPLRALKPCTVNLAMDLRTEVVLTPFEAGRLKVTSIGFDTAVFPAGEAPYDHPLGLVFAVADSFCAAGVHIDIRSASPPRSALGGSSVAAVALVAALAKGWELSGFPPTTRHEAAMTAHAVEEAVAGVACGIQDQLAAAFGGMNAWCWTPDPGGRWYERHPLLEANGVEVFDRHILAAYGGVTHESKDVNGRWVNGFLSGETRRLWKRIAELSRRFASAFSQENWSAAAEAMNQETDIRKSMTPDVLDDMGEALVASARDRRCGARFTGAGGGGCLWAIGEATAIADLRADWRELLRGRPDARMLSAGLDTQGLRVDCKSRE